MRTEEQTENLAMFGERVLSILGVLKPIELLNFSIVTLSDADNDQSEVISFLSALQYEFIRMEMQMWGEKKTLLGLTNVKQEDFSFGLNDSYHLLPG